MTDGAQEGHVRGKWVLILLTAIAAPVAFVIETVVRKLLFPAEFEEFRELAHDYATILAWGFVVIATLAAVAGLFVQRRLAKKRIAKLPASATAEQRERAALGAFMLAAAVPQVPAVFLTLLYMFGASLTPAVVGLAVSTLGVIAQAVRAR